MVICAKSYGNEQSFLLNNEKIHFVLSRVFGSVTFPHGNLAVKHAVRKSRLSCFLLTKFQIESSYLLSQ